MKKGKGVFIWKNGSRFEGEYLNDQKNGPGLMFNPKGILVLKTEWIDDKPFIPTWYFIPINLLVIYFSETYLRRVLFEIYLEKSIIKKLQIKFF